ncbi:unnamed protein product [Paramecium primaurelia]|uniref:Uncharacterized protein n=1 Tax=Paramecium primaurelia TaxID=5886 RepID=A0A8S1QHT4_PARPR|nr:unnamed protein product [Paramecium primaurelia]
MEKMVFLNTQYLEISFLGEPLLKEHLINITNKIILTIQLNKWRKRSDSYFERQFLKMYW